MQLGPSRPDYLCGPQLAGVCPVTHTTGSGRRRLLPEMQARKSHVCNELDTAKRADLTESAPSTLRADRATLDGSVTYGRVATSLVRGNIPLPLVSSQ
jgi:hypothetical protein